MMSDINLVLQEYLQLSENSYVTEISLHSISKCMTYVAVLAVVDPKLTPRIIQIAVFFGRREGRIDTPTEVSHKKRNTFSRNNHGKSVPSPVNTIALP